MIWRHFIDNIFCIWVGTLESLLSFFEYLNGIWAELQFTITYNEEQIRFLDTLIKKDLDGKLSSDLYRKETDRNSILYFESGHPQSVKSTIPKSQFQGINRIVSDPHSMTG